MSKHIWYEHIVCMDGFTLSVQAGEGLYCEPKESPYDENGYWRKDFGYKAVEIMMKLYLISMLLKVVITAVVINKDMMNLVHH